jgi:hypothetical protein
MKIAVTISRMVIEISPQGKLRRDAFAVVTGCQRVIIY